MSVQSTATLHARADRAAATGEFQSALALAAAVLHTAPLDHRARLKLGLCLAALGRVDDAVASLKVVAETLHHHGFVLAAIGACRDALGLRAGEPSIIDSLKAIHSGIHGLEGSSRTRVPPPMLPSDVDDAAVAAWTALDRDELVKRAAERGRASPVEGEPVAPEAVPLFSELSPSAFIRLVTEMGYLKVGAGHEVIKQGQTETSVFILLEGEVEVTQDSGPDKQVLARLSGGALFGEMALLTEKARQATVVTTEPSELFEVQRPVLEALAVDDPRVADDMVAFARKRLLFNVMAASPLFRPLGRQQRLGVLRQFEPRVVDAGATLITEGQRSEGLFVVVEGEVEVSKIDDGGDRVVLAYLKAGDVFGEIGVVEERPAMADVRAVEKTVLLCLPRTKFKAFAEAHPGILAVLQELSGTRREELETAMADGIALDADDLIIV